MFRSASLVFEFFSITHFCKKYRCYIFLFLYIIFLKDVKTDLLWYRKVKKMLF